MTAPPYLVAVDPAAWPRFAWATLTDGRAVGVGLGATPSDVPAGPAGRCVWVMERPMDYVGFGVAHKDLARLRRTLADLDAFARARGDTVEYVTPHQWKGNVPKPVHHRRALSTLGPGDLVVAGPDKAGYDHNACDALVLGLTRAGRVGRGGTKVTLAPA